MQIAGLNSYACDSDIKTMVNKRFVSNKGQTSVEV